MWRLRGVLPGPVHCLVVLLALTSAAASSAQTTGARGAEFQINSYTTNLQHAPRLGFQPGGGFVVVWNSGGYSADGIDGSAGGISLQLFNSDGTANGAELQVNTYTPGPQQHPSVDVAANGDFVVVWDSYGSAGSDVSSSSIHGRRFASDGTPAGDEFQVNDYTTDRQRQPAVAVGPAGDLVVLWEDLGFSSPFDGRDGSSIGLFGRRFASDGTPLGDGFQVNSYTTYTQYLADVSVAVNGDFVVTWTHRDDSVPDWDIRAQRFAADATPLGGELQINSYTTGSQNRAAIAVHPDGAFVVAWTGDGPDSSNTAILARRHASSGAPLGGDFQVSSYILVSPNQPPSIGATTGGGFVVAWESFRFDGPDTSFASVQAQRHRADGSRVGGEFLVNTFTTSDQINPALATHAGGGFVIAWASDGSSGSDADSLSVQGQRFHGLIFADGFESGDTTAWSSTLP
ncbi:MAG: hypothetical protein GY953_59170 [bacterium]|nr:hypothetical protein [bacterium]